MKKNTDKKTSKKTAYELSGGVPSPTNPKNVPAKPKAVAPVTTSIGDEFLAEHGLTKTKKKAPKKAAKAKTPKTAAKPKKAKAPKKAPVAKAVKPAKAAKTKAPRTTSEATKKKLRKANEGNVPWNKGKKTGVVPWNKGKAAPQCSHEPWNKGKKASKKRTSKKAQ